VPVEVVLVVVFEFEFCAKTKLPKLRTKTRIATIPKFFFTLSILLLNLAAGAAFVIAQGTALCNRQCSSLISLAGESNAYASLEWLETLFLLGFFAEGNDVAACLAVAIM
jgi:hypothetical protein